MSNEELANWQRIKEVMEEKGTTDNMFFKRAVEIAAGGKDPLDQLKFNSDCDK